MCLVIYFYRISLPKSFSPPYIQGNRCSLFEVAGFNAGLCEFQGWILPTRPAAALLGEELGKGDKMRKEIKGKWSVVTFSVGFCVAR